MTSDTQAKEASPLNDLIAAKEHSDKGDYGSKTHLVRNLLHKYPKDFVVDSPEGQFVGITHVPTGFKMHISRAVVPLELFKAHHGILKAQNDIVTERQKALAPHIEEAKKQQEQLDEIKNQAIEEEKQRRQEIIDAENDAKETERNEATAAAKHKAHQTAVRAFTLAHEKDASAEEDLMHLYSYVPRAAIEHVKEHGLLSGNELAKPENRHLLEIARPNGDADRWLKERDARLLKTPWTNSYNGPYLFFGDLDPDKIHDLHPTKKFDTTKIKIKLHELLKDYPDTKINGSELIPFVGDEIYDAMDEKAKDEFVHKRHHILALEEIKSLIARGKNPKDMWKDFKDTEGKYYASDVPHAQVITPVGKIPSKYIEFEDHEKSASDAEEILMEKIALHWTNDLTRDIMGGRHYPVSYLTGELAELGEAVKNRDWENFKEEIGDSAYAAQMLAGQKLGINLPVVGADKVIDKFYNRIHNWKQIFDKKGVPFSVDYLQGGSNYAKPEKIQKAFELAGKPISEKEAKEIADEHASTAGMPQEAQTKSASAQVLQAAGVAIKDPTEILPGGPMQASADPIKKSDTGIPMTGPEAIVHRLQNLNLAEVEQAQRDLIKSGKVSKRNNAVKTLNILEGFKRNNITGADLVVNKVPVIPPIFRPFRVAGSSFVPGDANELYRDLFTMRNLYKETADELGHENSGDARMGIYNAVKALYGFGDPVNTKTAGRGVTGFFKKITGANPKYCYDSETEILTRKYGWVFFKDLPEDTEVATLNPTTGAFEWQMPDAYVHAPFEGEMVRLSVGYRVDLLVTPNHRMWLRTRVGRMKESLTEENIVEGWEIEKAWKTANRAGRYWLQTAARGWDGSSVLPECAKGFGDVNLFAEWLGWWMAEGSIHSDGGILHIWQTKANMAYCEELDELMRKLTAAGLACSKNEHRRDGETIGWVWSIKKCRPLCEWLKASGGISCNTKTIPREILEWAKPQLELFLKSYLKGDGSKRILEIQRNGGATHKFRNPFTDSHGSFVTTSKALFDAITEIGIKIGITIYRRKSYPHLHPADRAETFIGSLVGKWNCVTEGNEAEFVPYSGEVHCCSVPNGLLFVRRNGKTVVSGNSFVQRQLLSKPQDTVSRGTITINPELTMNQVGVPKDMAWKMYSSYVQRRLVNLGYGPSDAIKAIKDQNPDALRALHLEIKERPVIVSRAPAWHKFNAVAAHPTLVDGNTVEINPFITTGMNADFDGDAMNVHVPASDEAVKEAYEKLLPSKMLFSIKDVDNVMPNLKHEQVLSLYAANKRQAKQKWKFASQAEALKAIKNGEVPLSDEVDYPGM